MPYWSNLLHEGIFLSSCTGRKKGKVINLFSGLLISSGKVLFGSKFSHQMEQSFQERQEAPLAGTNIGPNPKGPRFIHHSSRSLISDCILPDRFLSESVNSRQRKTKRGWAYKQKQHTHDFCLQGFSCIFYLLSAFACTRRSIKNEHTMHAYKILVILYFHIIYSDEQWLSLIISTREAQQLICVECDFWQRPEDECALNLAHVVLEHGLWFECASQLEAISDLERLAQRLRNGFVVIVRCQQLLRASPESAASL